MVRHVQVEGPIQYDAAIDPAVAAVKVQGGSEVAGKATVFVFPDLNTGRVTRVAWWQLVVGCLWSVVGARLPPARQWPSSPSQASTWMGVRSLGLTVGGWGSAGKQQAQALCAPAVPPPPDPDPKRPLTRQETRVCKAACLEKKKEKRV